MSSSTKEQQQQQQSGRSVRNDGDESSVQQQHLQQQQRQQQSRNGEPGEESFGANVGRMSQRETGGDEYQEDFGENVGGTERRRGQQSGGEHEENVRRRQQQQQRHGKGGRQSEERRSPTKHLKGQIEPTIEFFNKLVAQDTHCLLGRTGVKVSRICLGSMNFGKIDQQFGDRPGQLDESQAHKILDKYVELGGNCLDTANFFPWFGSSVGESETIIGNWLHKYDREKIVLITKIRLPTDSTNVNSVGLSRVNIINSVKNCLKRLRTNYIDLLLINGWDDTVNIAETVKDLDELIRADKIRYYGVCDVKGWQLQKICDFSKILNCHKCVCYEGEYNLLTRGCEWEVVEVCKNERIGFFGYAPLKYGILSDDEFKNLNQPIKGSRVEAASQDKPNLVAMATPFDEIRENPVFQDVMEACQKISKNRNWPIEQVALLWALQRGFVTSVVVSVKTVEELEECMNVLNNKLCLTWQEMCELNDAASLKLQYPYHTNLARLAGYRYISPELATSFEQLSLLTPPTVALTQEEQKQQRLHPDETSHESKRAHLPEKCC